MWAPPAEFYVGHHLMRLFEFRQRANQRLQIVLRWLGCLGFFKLIQGVFLFFAFPMGGGVFHAMFAYTEAGREGVALQMFGLLAASTLISNFVLQFFRSGVPWWGLAILGSAACADSWLDVTTWSPVAPGFRHLVELLAWCLPVACLASSVAVYWAVRKKPEAHDG
ncbi:hypothetical protein C7C56_005805 [Massilia glaciei]|uniref:Uncharacterized protein n=1 Tax=Massilia glaciei TaxID=1524097 RepID=A0A2U2I4K6_9BURK|nr:hypothetical protein C7C56_005805 [Massilia glaciei]